MGRFCWMWKVGAVGGVAERASGWVGCLNQVGGWWLVLAAWAPGTLKLGSNMPTLGRSVKWGCISLWNDHSVS